MNIDYKRQKTFTRRTLVIGGGQLLLVSGLVARMYQLQIMDANKYKMMAEENRINIHLVPPIRGKIFDRYGQIIATNRENYRLLLIPEDVNDLQFSLYKVQKLIPLTESEKERILKDVKRNRSFVPILIKENLNWDEVSSLSLSAPDLPGLFIEEGQTRYYPDGDRFAHLIGHVGIPSEKEIDKEDNKRLLLLPNFRLGKAGIEKYHDLNLRGTAGQSQMEVNAAGRVIRELGRSEGVPGNDLILTIHAEIQRQTFARLGEESAACVVMDIHTGDVLTLCSTPSFDANRFNEGIDQAYWNELINNERHPLINKAISGTYPPGSTFKLLVALAALDSGVVSPDQHVFCNGHMELGNRRFHCWKKEGHGSVDMNGAIMGSCDVYFYETARRIGIDRISEMARRLGLGATHNIEIPGEKPGLIPTREWKQARFKAPWTIGETIIAGIGQGYTLATPLQLAVMVARIANGGYAVEPHLTLGLIDARGEFRPARKTFPSLGIAREHLELVRHAADNVVNSPRGTAFAARIQEPGYEMGGKTGTSQVRRISAAEHLQGVRKNEDLPWHLRDQALFIGYAPVSDPKYATAVIVEHGGSGSHAAAPIARDVLLLTQKIMQENQKQEILDQGATLGAKS